MIQLQQQLSRNIWSSWVGYACRIVISFLFIPFITSVLGDARYGVWVIIFQTINYFALLDLGLEKALTRFLSKFLSRESFDQINRTLNTAFGLYLIIGSAIIVGAWLTATFLFGYFNVENPALAAEGKTALMIIGLYMGIRFILHSFAGSLGGFQRFDIANGLNIAEEIVKVLLMVWLLLEGYGLVALALVILGVSLLRQAVAIVCLTRLHPAIRISPKLFDRDMARQLFGYSRVTFGITLAWLIIFNTDVVLLGLLASSAAAGVYAPGAQLMLYLRNAVNAVATPLTAAISHMEAAGNNEAIRRIYFKGLRYTSYLSFFMAAGVILYARPFVALWLEPEFAEAAEVMRILAVSAAFFIPQLIGNAVLFGTDNHRYLLLVLTCEAVLKLGLSLLLIEPYGLVGMAIAAAIPQLLLYTTIYPVLLARTMKTTAAQIVMASLRYGFPALFVSVPIAIIARLIIPPTNWGTFALNIALVTAAAAVGSWFVLEPNDRMRVRNRFTTRR